MSYYTATGNLSMDELCKFRAVSKIINFLGDKISRREQDALIRQMIELNFDTHKEMEEIANLIYEIAVDESDLSFEYAVLCQLPSIMRVSGDFIANISHFRTLLVNRCQKEFQIGSSISILRNEKFMEIEKCLILEKKKELLLYEEKEKIMLMKALGNIRFIGELFKQGMLAKETIHYYLKQLLQQGDEENLECLCKLLMTLGADFDYDNDTKFYYEQIQNMANNRKISFKVRFLLQEVVNLKTNNTIGENNKTSKLRQNKGTFTLFPQTIPTTQHISISNKPEKSEDELINIADQLVEKYIAKGNKENVVHEIKENIPPSQLPMLVSEIIDTVLEKTTAARESISKIFSFLIIHKSITLNDFRKGLNEVLDFVDDLLFDIPKIWSNIADILVYPLIEGSHPISELPITLADLRCKGHTGKFLGELLFKMAKICGPVTLTDKWSQSRLQLSDVIDGDRENIEEIVKNYKLQFLFEDCKDKSSLTKQTSTNFEHVRDNLIKLMKNSNCNFDDYCSWITDNIGDRIKEPQFVRILTTAILEVSTVCDNQRYDFKPDIFQSLQLLIQKFVDSNEKLELECLFAAQAFANKLEFPPGLLLNIFDKLCKDNIISFDAFIQWENNEDMAEREGKAVALKALAGFFLSLKNNDEVSKKELEEKEVKLRESNNAWKPSTFDKRVRRVLNILTPQKFVSLVSQIKVLNIDTEEKMKEVIKPIFEKVIDDPSFSVVCALMCKELSSMQVSEIDLEDTTSANFRKLIITHCQTEFEKEPDIVKLRETKAKEIQDCQDLEKKKELLALYDEEERRIPIKLVGKIKFIGELFKLGILTQKILYFCIKDLLQQREETLECLCKLLTTIGKTLDDNENMKDYFKQMQNIVDNKGPAKISSRVRFMLKDLIDLRANKWVPRRRLKYDWTVDRRRNCGYSEKDFWSSKIRLSSASYSRYTSKFKVKPPSMNDLQLGNRSTYMWNKNVYMGLQ